MSLILIHHYVYYLKINREPFGLRMDPHIDVAEINLNNITNIISLTPPWLLKSPRILFDLTQYRKATTSDLQYKHLFYEIQDSFNDYIFFYTDGSKDGCKCGAACLGENFECVIRFPDNTSIFTAEAKASFMTV